MRILCLHVNSIKWEGVKKAIKDPEPLKNKKGSAKDCLAIFISVEKRDEKDPEAVVEKLIKEIKSITEQLKVKTVVLYPYVHLTSTPGNPKTALQVLDMAEERLQAFKVVRSPFGWYKSFTIDVKGHPLAELSREFGPEEKKEKHHEEESFEFSSNKLSKEEKITLSTAAIVGEAVKELFAKAQIGGVGFYQGQGYVDIHGIDLKQNQFPKIEKKAKEISKKINFKKSNPDNSFQKEIAKDLGKKAQSYTLEKITVTPTYSNPFVSGKEIGALKLMNLASAYWKGSADNKQLFRIYCLGFANESKLNNYLVKLEEMEKRDHRRIGKELDLFSFNDVTPGSPFFHSKGAIIYLKLQEFLRDFYPDWGYEEVITPLIYDNSIWKKSGHWDHYRENMFLLEMDGKPASFKPMNCPSHILIFKNKMHSYRDLPRRIIDFAPLHRNELKGTLGGLMRVRKFSQDDCHVFCTPEQLKDEIKAHIEHCRHIYEDIFGFDFYVELSTKPDKAMGDPKQWKQAEKWLEEALKENKMKYKVNPGEGAFYGPKIDFHIKDALGRSWQCGTEQLDFQMPQRFNVNYEGKDGKKHQVVMLHRTVLGSIERFMGILLEHYAGKFPLWLSPVQVKIMTVNDDSMKFAKKVYDELRKQRIRTELDNRRETIGRKVRDAQIEKINYMVTIGDKEVKNKTLAVRDRTGKLKFDVPLEKFVSEILSKIEKKSR